MGQLVVPLILREWEAGTGSLVLVIGGDYWGESGAAGTAGTVG